MTDAGVAPLVLDDGVWLVDTGLYRAERRTLALADLHLGHEHALREQGVMLPETQFSDVLVRLDRTLAALGAGPRRPLEALVLNGDLRHAFGPLNAAEWRQLDALLAHAAPAARRIVVVQGNHDPALDALARRHAQVTVCEAHLDGGWLYVHGDRLPELPAEAAGLVIGHEHPALVLRDPVTGRRERFKAFLRGAFAGRTLWVLPASNPLVQGSDLVATGGLSPVLQGGVWQGCEAFLRNDDGRVFPFGPVRRLAAPSAGAS